MKFLTAVLMSLALPLQAAPAVTVKGSDTMVILIQRWAEAYMAENPAAIVQVTGGGSGTGISALINGSTEICASSRPMSVKEKNFLKQKYGSEGVEIPVAKDGVAVYLNERNPVKVLTLAQIKGLYTGKISNWKDVGGEDARVILYSRENNSGTYVFFKEHMLRGNDLSPYAQSLPGTAGVVNAVSRDKHGIGYGGAAYAKGIRYCGVKADGASPAYLPDAESVSAGRYAASRPLFFYARTALGGEGKKFIDWVLSPKGQKIVTAVGYFPLK
jgi:phosphate transport system substrate-binding protein